MQAHNGMEEEEEQLVTPYPLPLVHFKATHFEIDQLRSIVIHGKELIKLPKDDDRHHLSQELLIPVGDSSTVWLTLLSWGLDVD
ncbi:hypothetical protein GW17_00036098 [Ensete ventricosum]|nr:hypothetical protein GW17_00036098 [Ensete ventricosum]